MKKYKGKILLFLFITLFLCGIYRATMDDFSGNRSSIPVQNNDISPLPTRINSVKITWYSTPYPTAEPTQRPKATATPKPTKKPKATATPKPTAKPKATPAPKPTAKPKATPAPKPTATPAPAKIDNPGSLTAKSSTGRTVTASFFELENAEYETTTSPSGTTTLFMPNKDDTDSIYDVLQKRILRGDTSPCTSFDDYRVTWKDMKKLILRLLEIPGIEYINCTETNRYWNCSRFKLDISVNSILYAWEAGTTELLNDEEKETLKIAKKIVKQANEYESDYLKEVFFHDYLVKTIAYDNFDFDNSGQTAYGALVLKKCVCAGYARAFQLLLLMSGIDARYVTGDGDGEPHAWNKVKIEGKWYNVDVTWDDPTPDKKGQIGYSYLNVTDEYLAKTHDWDKTSFPVCTATKYNYCQREFKTCDTKTAIVDYCKTMTKKGEKQFIIRFCGKQKTMDDALQELNVRYSYWYWECQGGTYYDITLN